jgi:lysophospholipase L1-like esterase
LTHFSIEETPMRLMNWIATLAGSALLAAGTLVGSAAAPATPAADAGHKPTVFLIGDSTVRNGSLDNGATDGQWGWGHLLHYYFDDSKVTIINDAMGGTSSRSYQESPTLWALVLPKIKPGDYVIMQFGHNDSPATLRGNGDELGEARGGRGSAAQVHSFGWYMRQYIKQTHEKGATAIVCSLIPRNRWTDGKVDRNDENYALWAKEAAEQEHALFIPLGTLIADKYDKIGQEKVAAELFPPKEAVHPNWAGAKLNAECVVEGIRALDCPLKNFLKADAKAPDEADIKPPAHGELGPTGTMPVRRGRAGPPAGRAGEAPGAMRGAPAPAPAQ